MVCQIFYLTNKGTGGKRIWAGIRLITEEEGAQVTQVTPFPENFSHKGDIYKGMENPVTSVTGHDLSPSELKIMPKEYANMTLETGITLWNKKDWPTKERFFLEVTMLI